MELLRAAMASLYNDYDINVSHLFFARFHHRRDHIAVRAVCITLLDAACTVLCLCGVSVDCG